MRPKIYSRNFGAVTNVVEIFKGRALAPPNVSRIEIHIPAMSLSIECNKKISVSTIVAIVFEIARMILKQILEEINEIEVEKYCGKRYERGNCLRNGKRKRKIVTLLGEVILNLTRIRGKGIPLYNVIEFESGNFSRHQSSIGRFSRKDTGIQEMKSLYKITIPSNNMEIYAGSRK